MQFDISHIKIIAGLGNFEPKYHETRHNAGYMLVDSLREKYAGTEWKHDTKLEAETCKIILSNDGDETPDQAIILVKPTTGMNISGRAVQKLLNYYRIDKSSLLLAYDDLDLDLGSYKLQFNKYPKVHNGVNSVIQYLSTADFWHLRLGIDNRDKDSDHKVMGVRYTLERFTHSEKQMITDTLGDILDYLI